MSIIPSLGRRGVQALDATSARREEAIQRLWTFLAGLRTVRFRLTTGASAGKVLTSDADGDASWGSTLPATTVALAGQTTNQIDTLVATASGEYLVTMYVEITTAGSGGTLYSSLSYTDDIGATTLYPLASLPCNSTGRDQWSGVLRCSGGGVEYTFSIVGGAGNPAYNAYVSVTQVR